jgi:hypothetical protein
MGEPSEHDAQRRRAEELRSEIEKLRRGSGGFGAPSPREFTDEAAAEAASHHSDAQE